LNIFSLLKARHTEYAQDSDYVKDG